jgi:phosphatidate cytidylyltransferase
MLSGWLKSEPENSRQRLQKRQQDRPLWRTRKKKRRKRPMNNFIVRTITAIIFVAVIVASFLRAETMVLLFALVTGLTIWEFSGLVNDRPQVTVNRMITTVAGVYLFFAMAGFCSELTPSAVFIPYLITLVYLMVAELYLKHEDPINDWAYTMMTQLYIALPFSLLNALAFHLTPENEVIYDPVLPLCMFVFLWINDAGAYICGSLLGKHKLFPRISPGKSWEGSIGGGILVMLVAYFIPSMLDHFSLLTLNFSPLQWSGLGLVIVVFGTWGDLIESLFKRTLGIKDSGNVLPGHGGMLDRFDSSLLAIPAAVVYIYTLLYI